MRQRLWRQWRRIVLAALLGALIGLTGLCGLRPLGAGAALAGAAFGLLTVLVTVVLAPGWRGAAVKLAVAVPVAMLVCRLAGGGVPGLFAGALSGLAVLAIPTRSAVLDAIRIPGIVSRKVTGRVDKPFELVWLATLPRPGHDYWDASVGEVQAGRTDDHFVLTGTAETGAGRTPLHVFDVVETRAFKCRVLTHRNAQLGGPVAVTGYELEPDGDATRLTITEGTWRQGLWSALGWWLDDRTGEQLDRIAAHVEGRPDRSVTGASLPRPDGEDA